MRLPSMNVLRSVRMDKNELLAVIRKNKESHTNAFLEAVEDYKVAAVKLAQDNLKLAKTGDMARISKTRQLPTPPVSYEESYSEAIAMLEMSVDSVIELEAQVFNQLVLDKWDWKTGFTAAAQLYKSMS